MNLMALWSAPGIPEFGLGSSIEWAHTADGMNPAPPYVDVHVCTTYTHTHIYIYICICVYRLY